MPIPRPTIQNLEEFPRPVRKGQYWKVSGRSYRSKKLALRAIWHKGLNPRPLVVNYGGGTNSTALLVGLQRLGVCPDAVVFADTGGERKHTYEFLNIMSAWLVALGLPPITVVRWVRVRAPYTGQFISLERLSLMRRELPSIAYGFKGCSRKWKGQPVDKWVKVNFGKNAVRLLGIDAGEERRAKGSKEWDFRYPLINWDWARDECVEVIASAGLKRPGKSSCFFCPNMRPAEILDLKMSEPELFERALAIEANAISKEGSSIKGLARSKRWADIVPADAGNVVERDTPCGCYDG